AHVTHDANYFGRHGVARHQQCLTNWILVAKDFARTGLTDQDHIGMTDDVALVEVASGKKWDSPGAKISGRDIVRRSDRTLRNGWHRTVRPGIKSSSRSASEREVTADRDRFKTGHRAQDVGRFFAKTLPRSFIGVTGLREGNEGDPEVFGTKTEILLTQ